MSAINSPPIGLQSLLGSQNFGDNPNELARTVFGGIDLVPFLGSQFLAYTRDTGSLNGAGIPIEFRIPDGESWYLLRMAGTIAGAALTTQSKMQITVTDFDFGGSNAIPMPIAAAIDQTTINTGEADALIFQPSQPVIFGPGTTFQLRQTIHNSGQVDEYELFSQHYRLKT